NPLAQLPGNGKYIVRFPRFGRTRGIVIINPDSTDTKDFALFKLAKGKAPLPNGDDSWQDNELLGCLLVNRAIDCHNTMLDTGNPDTHFYSKRFTGSNSIPSGNEIALVLGSR